LFNHSKHNYVQYNGSHEIGTLDVDGLAVTVGTMEQEQAPNLLYQT